MLRFSPSMIEIIAMIAVMPMMTPRTVRKERSLLVRSDSKAIDAASRISIATAYSWRSATIGSRRAARVAG